MKITLLTGKTYKIEEQIPFPIKIKKSITSKRLTLRIDSKERIPVLTIPRFTSAKRAVAFVLQNEGWITENLKKIPTPRPFKDGLTFSFFGSDITICHNPDLRAGVFIKDGIMHVSGQKQFLNRRVKDFIKEKAKDKLYKLTKKKSDLIGATLNDVTIKDTKSRWGSCSSKNNINYTWRIALAPKFVIDYLVSHEAAHLKHQDHSKNFWKCVAELCPNYAEGRSWLKVHGKELYLYD